MSDGTDPATTGANPIVTTTELLDGIARFVLFTQRRAHECGDTELEGRARQAYWWTFDVTNRLREWGV